MEFQRRPSAVSQLSYSDTDLDKVDPGRGGDGGFLSDLLGRSHFFAPSRDQEGRAGSGRVDPPPPLVQRYSTPLILISPENSTHNSMSNIPSSMATGSTHSSGEASPPVVTSYTPLKKSTKPKKFSLNLNGSVSQGSTPLTPISPDFPITLDSPEKPRPSGVHVGDQYVNKERLADDLCALSSMPELCDVTFLVGTDRQPICGVRAILAARSR